MARYEALDGVRQTVDWPLKATSASDLDKENSSSLSITSKVAVSAERLGFEAFVGLSESSILWQYYNDYRD